MSSPSLKASPTSSPHGSKSLLLEEDSPTKTSFPSTFQDFFSKFTSRRSRSDESTVRLLDSEESDPVTVKERGKETVSPRKKQTDKQWTTNRSFYRKSNELVTKAPPKSEGKPKQNVPLNTHRSRSAFPSPRGFHRRSSSLVNSRTSLDSYRSYQPETRRRLNMQLKSSSDRFLGITSTPTKGTRSLRNSPVHDELGRYRERTSSLSGVPARHRPMLGQTKREEPKPEPGMEYYRLRSFSITPTGVYNLGDSFKTRISRSSPSVASAEGNQAEAGACSKDCLTSTDPTEEMVPTYKVAVMGAAGVGKSSLIQQFTTSDYTCAYDSSLDDDCDQTKISVLLDGKETELNIIESSTEVSIETFCSTYTPDVFVVVYSIDDVLSLEIAEDMLMHFWKSDSTALFGVILVGNKADLARKREIPTSAGRKLADEYRCKFIETSSGIDHNVDELLVGILAQAALNPTRINRRHLLKKSRFDAGKKILRFLTGRGRKTRSCENLLKL